MTTENLAKIDVNPSVLRAARRRANLSPQAAVERINRELRRLKEAETEVGAFSAWERGEAKPTLVQAEQLARVLLIPFVDLFQESLQPEILTDFRRLGGSSQTELSYDARTRLEVFGRFYKAAKRITSSLGLLEDVSVRRVPLDAIQTSDDVEHLGSDIRAALGITDVMQMAWADDAAALAAWRSAIEGVGVFVFQLSLPIEDCRGASKWEPGAPPAILINTADAVPAQLFTLLHEYCHLIFSTESEGAVCDPAAGSAAPEEILANRVAAAALVPKHILDETIPDQRFDSSYGDWPPEVRRRLRGLLRVSHAVIGIRLQQLNMVEDAGVRPWRQPGGFVRGRNRPVWQRYQRYLGPRTLSLAKASIQEKRVSPTELSRILGIKVRDVERAVA